MTLTLYQHQNIALPALKRMENKGKGGFLADSMGLGKTVTMAMHLMRNKLPGKKDLIVCPLSLMKQWRREIERVYKASNFGKPKILYFHGSKRMKKLDEKKWDYVITTYSVIGAGQLNRKKWGRVVLDESHTIKNGLQTKKPKCAVAAFEIGKRSKYNWCITGTPFNNRINDLASQCKFIGTAPYNDPKWWKINSDNQEELAKWRKKFVLRRTKDNILKPPIYHNIEVTPTRRERLLVDKLRGQAKEKFENWKKAKGLEKIKFQGQILGLIQRLRVVSNSYYCGENDIDVDDVLEENAKVDDMINLLEEKVYEDPSNSVVVFSQFTSYLDVIEKVIEEVLPGIEVMKFTGSLSSDERDEVVTDFTTSDNPRILLISLMAGGCGLNLIPCSTIVLSEPYYNPFLEKQAEDRVHRLGQKNQVNVYRFSVSNSVETWINKLKDKKLFMASGFDFLSKHDSAPTEFNFKDLGELFNDLVWFKDYEEKKDPEETSKNKSKKKSKNKPSSPKVNLGIDCPICMEDVGNKGVYNLSCGHLFHHGCLNEWLLNNDTCPMCREKINIL